MLSRHDVVNAALAHGFEDIGFTTAEPFDSHRDYLAGHQAEYGWAEAVGLYIYGCDRCQNVCPRNAAWLAADLPVNRKVAAKAQDFDLSRLLAMDAAYFQSRVWPHMFYMAADDLWRWKMNVARAMGNTRDPVYIPDLVRALAGEDDPRAKAMAAWALGRIGGPAAFDALKTFTAHDDEMVRQEVVWALAEARPSTA